MLVLASYNDDDDITNFTSSTNHNQLYAHMLNTLLRSSGEDDIEFMCGLSDILICKRIMQGLESGSICLYQSLQSQRTHVEPITDQRII